MKKLINSFIAISTVVFFSTMFVICIFPNPVPLVFGKILLASFIGPVISLFVNEAKSIEKN